MEFSRRKAILIAIISGAVFLVPPGAVLLLTGGACVPRIFFALSFLDFLPNPVILGLVITSIIIFCFGGLIGLTGWKGYREFVLRRERDPIPFIFVGCVIGCVAAWILAIPFCDQ